MINRSIFKKNRRMQVFFYLYKKHNCSINQERKLSELFMLTLYYIYSYINLYKLVLLVLQGTLLKCSYSPVYNICSMENRKTICFKKCTIKLRNKYKSTHSFFTDPIFTSIHIKRANTSPSLENLLYRDEKRKYLFIII